METDPLTVQQLHQRNAAWNDAFDHWFQQAKQTGLRMDYTNMRAAYMAGRQHQSAIPQASTWAAGGAKPIPEGGV